jgi:hypothetical protein
MCSHWNAKSLLSDFARGSANIRVTCAASTSGLLKRDAVASFTSSSSGRLLQRKNDKRDASSRSLSVRVAVVPTPDSAR